jgi:hypothetical protein
VQQTAQQRRLLAKRVAAILPAQNQGQDQEASGVPSLRPAVLFQQLALPTEFRVEEVGQPQVQFKLLRGFCRDCEAKPVRFAFRLGQRKGQSSSKIVGKIGFRRSFSTIFFNWCNRSCSSMISNSRAFRSASVFEI